LNGKGVERNVGEAFKLFELAANQGDGWGLNNLGGMYEMGWGVTKNREKAAGYYKQAAEKGIESAQANLERLTPGSAPAAPVTLN
jgi:TPR repeat protein